MGDRVQVAVRVRPLNRREIDLGSQVIVDMDGNQTILRHPKWAAKLAKNSKESIKKYEPKTFAFDFSFWSIDEQNTSKFAGQEKVFEHVGSAILARAFEGYNACILAYGQTGSGKSYSMMGSHEQKGIIPRFCERLFHQVGQNVSGHVSFRILVSYMEIYNEKVRDLLEPGSKHNLSVREHSVLGPYVDGLLQLAVETYKEIECLLAEGTKARTVAATNMNSESSRSHAVFTITLVRTQTDLKTGTASERVSRINLVDLAGSERASKTGSIGERLREGGNINRSLTTLGLVVKALAERSGKHQSKFVPYRDSVLTWLLKDSLGGNSKTVMLALVSPASDNYEESLSTLRYADSAKHIVNNAVVNEDPNSRIIRELRHEIDELRQRLAQAETLKAPHLKEQLNLSERLMMDICKPWEERLQETERIQRERQGTLESMGIHVESSGIKVDAGRCFLVNLNADPSLNELLVYYLKAHTRVGRVTGGGQDVSSAGDVPDIQLEGIGIMPHHCTLDVEQSKVYVAPIESARTCINGTAISCRTRARNGDRILWGNNHFFRLNCPKDDNDATFNPPNQTGIRRSAEYELAQEELMQQEMAENPIHFAIEGMEKKLNVERNENTRRKSTVANLSSTDRLRWPAMDAGLDADNGTVLLEDDTAAGVEAADSGVPYVVVPHAKKKRSRCDTDANRLENLRKELYRAHSFAREANMLASSVPWCDVVYEVSLQIPACDLSPSLQRLEKGLESRPSIMARTRAHAEQKQLFTLNEFEGRLVAMRELCLGGDRNGGTVVPQPSDESGDNPFTVSNSWHDLIGVANVFLDALFHEVALDHWVVIVNQYGEVAGRLHVALTKAGDGLVRRSNDDEHDESGRSSPDQPSSSAKKIAVKVSIKEARDLPSDLANFVFCQYKFWNCSNLVTVPPAMSEPDDGDVTENSSLGSNRTSVKFDHVQDYLADVTDDFVDYVSGGNALSIEVYGHRRDPAATQAALGLASPPTTQLLAEPMSSLAARWAEVTCRVELCVQVLELGEAGQYEPVELRQSDDVSCGGVFQLRQGFSKRLRVDVACLPESGRLPVTSLSIDSVCIGGICLRSQSHRGLDSYHEQGLELLRQRWHAALDRRRAYLSSKTASAHIGAGSDDAGSIGDTASGDLKVAWDELISEMDAVCSPAAGSGVPGAPTLTMRSPAGRAEQHIPVIFLDLGGVDDCSADGPSDLFDSVSESDSEGPVVVRAIGEQWLLDKEEGTTFIQLPIVQRSAEGSSPDSGGTRSSAVASWDSTLHDSIHLNMVTLPGERVYLTAKAYVRLGLHPEPSVVVFRKRICVSVFRKSSLSYKLRKSVGSPRGSPLAVVGSPSASARNYRSDGCSVTFEVISSIPKALNQLESGETLARLAASSGVGGEACSCSELSVTPGRGNDPRSEGVVSISGQSYIEQYLRSIAAIETIILADKAGQEAAVKESLFKAGRSLRRFGSTPSVGTVDKSSRYLFSPRGEAVTPPLLQSRLAMSVRDLSKSRSPAWSESSSGSTASVMIGGRFLRQTFAEADSPTALPTYPEVTSEADEDRSPCTEAPSSTSTPRLLTPRAAAGLSRLSMSRSSAATMPVKPGASRLSFLSCVAIPGEGSGDEDDAYMPAAKRTSMTHSRRLHLSSHQYLIGSKASDTSASGQQPADLVPSCSPSSPIETAAASIDQNRSDCKASGASKKETNAAATSIVHAANTQEPGDAAAVTDRPCLTVLGGPDSAREVDGSPNTDSGFRSTQMFTSGGRLSAELELPSRAADSTSDTAGRECATGGGDVSSDSYTQAATTCQPASASSADDSNHRAIVDKGDGAMSTRITSASTESCRSAPDERGGDQLQLPKPTEHLLDMQQMQSHRQTVCSGTSMTAAATPIAGDHSTTHRSRLELISDPYSLTALDRLEAAEESNGSSDSFGSEDEGAGTRCASVVSPGSSCTGRHMSSVRGGRLRSPIAGDSDSDGSGGNSECSFGSLADLVTSGDDAVPSWLQRGATVVVLSTRGKPPRIGVVRSIGETVIAPGTWVGVQFHDCVGKNDGSVRGVRYFRCPSGHGIFVRPDRVLPNRKDKLHEADDRTSATVGTGLHVMATAVVTTDRFLEPYGKNCQSDSQPCSETRDHAPAAGRLVNAQPAATAKEPELWLPLATRDTAPLCGLSDAVQSDVVKHPATSEKTSLTGSENSMLCPPVVAFGASHLHATAPPAALTVQVVSASAVRSSDSVVGVPSRAMVADLARTTCLQPAPAAVLPLPTTTGTITWSPSTRSTSALSALSSDTSAADLASKAKRKPTRTVTTCSAVPDALRTDTSHGEGMQLPAVDIGVGGRPDAAVTSAPADAAILTTVTVKAASTAVTSTSSAVDRSIASSSSSSFSSLPASAAANTAASAAATVTSAVTPSVAHTASHGVVALPQRAADAAATDSARSAAAAAAAAATVTIARTVATAAPAATAVAAASGATAARSTPAVPSKTGTSGTVISAGEAAVSPRPAVNVSYAMASGLPEVSAAAAGPLPNPGRQGVGAGALSAERTVLPQAVAAISAATHGPASRTAAPAAAAVTPMPVSRPETRASALRTPAAVAADAAVVAADDRTPVNQRQGAAELGGRQKSSVSTSQTLARLESAEPVGRASPAPSGDGSEPEEARLQRKGSFKKLKVPSFMRPTSSSSSKKK